MMKINYLMRLDDATPGMDIAKWSRIERILDKYNIKPLVGIIPNNQSPTMDVQEEDPNFWDKVKCWKSKGWSIALHGNNHVYISNDPGINPLWNRSEFAGVSEEKQRQKIKEGISVFRNHGIDPDFFYAPSHTFDKITLKVLKEETNIRIISDTIGLNPYKKYDFVFIPQMSGLCRKMFFPGIYTFCLHPTKMNEEQFSSVEVFLDKYPSKFMSFSDIDYAKVTNKSLFSCMISWLYFTRRKLMGLR